ncbi:hypothetical protein HMPREF9446_02333 [Bacteroides fluxus YIT 12057]|uniref:Uncharacterized protein n=1 Tax=Bacteroides fluxus YIT 12057 TaxID=763034 RepID=F3PUB1_9BACE|nr:hypothetical protein HMPREF9446_02333 [Bacteroides fluxus YIT 12057]
MVEKCFKDWTSVYSQIWRFNVSLKIHSNKRAFIQTKEFQFLSE